MRSSLRGDVTARLFLTLGALLPYWRFLTFGVIFVTDDRFTSDIFNGELPGRVLAGQILRHGQWPTWTNQLCSGLPMAGFPAEPIGLASFTLLSPPAALDLLVVAMLLVAAHGAYGLSRRLGANRIGSVLAGLAFSGSGYIAVQLKHLAIVSTVVWLPVGLLLLDQALSDRRNGSSKTLGARLALIAIYGLVFAEQVLGGFPQSAYICALVYASFVLFKLARARHHLGSWRESSALVTAVGLATALGATAGAVVLLPLLELGRFSDRSLPAGLTWSYGAPYWPPNLITFFAPYINGDISNNTYVGKSIFWEDYGYVGAATTLLALLCTMAWRRRLEIQFLAAMTAIAYLLVLGPLTPAYHLAYEILPGLKTFRFPTRFLFVVDLGLAVLGGLGLTFVRAELTRLSRPASRLPILLTLGICVGTAADLWIHQPRQNPVVPGRTWLSPPTTVDLVRGRNAEPRTFSPGRYQVHQDAFVRAAGWSNTEPYFQLRDLLEPNAGGGYWHVPSADCYSGIAPTWSVDVWGDHNRDGLLVRPLVHEDVAQHILRFDPPFATIMKTYGVTDVITAFPASGTTLPFIGRAGSAYVYRVDDAERVRVVSGARWVRSDEEAAAAMLDPSFRPETTLLLSAPDSADGLRDQPERTDSGAWARIMSEDSTTVNVDAEAPTDSYLLLADSYYPGWTAEIDGAPTTLYRADISIRAIDLPKGHHRVRFVYSSSMFLTGAMASVSSILLLLLGVVGGAYLDRRTNRKQSMA